MLIVEKLSKGKHASLNELKDFLFDHDFEFSERTLQRDLEQIRNEFGMEIEYNRIKNAYFINKSKSINIDSFLRFLEIVNTANLLTDSIRKGQNALNYIYFESYGLQKGMDHLKALLFAIQNKRYINFIHENFVSGKKKSYSIQPYMLKEYQNRWYIIGSIKNQSAYRTFGIDRITALEVSDQTFKLNNIEEVLYLFDNTIGLVYDQHPVEDIILSCTPLQGKYLKSLPLHKSQQIISDTKKEVRLKIRVASNYELQQKILMLGSDIKVIKPAWLAKEIAQMLKNTLKQYK